MNHTGEHKHVISHMHICASNWSFCVSAVYFLGGYSKSGHLGSRLSTQSNENTILSCSAFLCLIDDKKLADN